MANSDKGNIEVINGSIGDLIFRVETLTSDRDTIKICVRAANELTAINKHIDEQAATIARLTAANESMQEDAVQNTYAFNLMLTANKAQAAEIAQIKEQVQETLDLLRTGCAPDAFNMDANQWNTHKINRAASFLSALLRDIK